MSSFSSIKAAEGYVEVTVKNDKLEGGLRQAESSMQKFQKRLDGWSMAVGAGLTAAFMGATRALKSFFGGLIGYGDQLDKMSQRIGVSVESLSKLSTIAQYSGSSLESMEGHITKLEKAIGDASTKGGEAEAKFRSLGLSVSDLNKMSPEESFRAVINALGGITNQTERTSKAMAIFGKSATDLFPLINSGANGFDQMAEKIDELGIGLSKADATNLATLNDSITTVKTTISALTQNLLVSLTPAITAVADVISTVIGTVSKFAKEHKTLTSAITASVTVFGTATAGMMAWSLAAGKLSAGIKLVNVALKALSANPWVLGITAAVGGIMLLINAFKKSKPEIDEVTHKAEELTRAHNEQAGQDQALMNELNELNAKTNKSAKEMQRAEQIVGTLTDRYGDLGLSVNKATGEIEGLSEAQRKMNEAQKALKIADTQAEIAELEKNYRAEYGEGTDNGERIEKLQKRISEANFRYDENGNKQYSGEFGVFHNRQKDEAELIRLNQGANSAKAQIQARKDYLEALQNGTAPTIEGTATPTETATDKAYDEAWARSQATREQAENIGKSTYDLRREEAQKEYDKAIADAETVKKGNIENYGLSAEEAEKTYAEMVANAGKILNDKLTNIDNDIQKEAERKQKEEEANRQRLADSETSQAEKDYTKGMEELESLRNQYTEALKNGEYEKAEELGNELDQKKDELELARTNTQLETAVEILQEKLDKLNNAEANGTDEEKINARNEYKQAQEDVSRLRDEQTATQKSLADRQRQIEEERLQQQQELADKQKEQMEKQAEYNKILSQDINANLQQSAHSRGSFNAWEMAGGGVTTEEKQLKEAERANKWNEKIYRELKEFNQKEMSATYA